MKMLLIITFSLLIMTRITTCNFEDTSSPIEISSKSKHQRESNTMKLNIKIGSTTFIATLVDNETTTAFKTMLPMTIDMSDLNGNEKYYNLPTSLPTTPIHPGTIHTGDIMLFGSETLVLFYKTFSTSYKYTRIGRIDNISEFQKALSTNDVKITFTLVQE